jgi:hypothetical protein
MKSRDGDADCYELTKGEPDFSKCILFVCISTWFSLITFSFTFFALFWTVQLKPSTLRHPSSYTHYITLNLAPHNRSLFYSGPLINVLIPSAFFTLSKAFSASSKSTVPVMSSCTCTCFVSSSLTASS